MVVWLEINGIVLSKLLCLSGVLPYLLVYCGISTVDAIVFQCVFAPLFVGENRTCIGTRAHLCEQMGGAVGSRGQRCELGEPSTHIHPIRIVSSALGIGVEDPKIGLRIDARPCTPLP